MIFKFYANPSLGITNVEAGLEIIEKSNNEVMNCSINEQGIPFEIDSMSLFLSTILNPNYKEKNIKTITNARENSMLTFLGYYLSYHFADTWYLILNIEKKTKTLSCLTQFTLLVECFNSYWAKVSPREIEGRFTRQSFTRYVPSSQLDLPKLPNIKVLDSPYIPANLGWLNYWPAPTLKRVNFQEEHRALFHSVQPAANDGLILQITEEPLDLDNAEHLRKTVAIYDALPAVGGRDCV